jgi:hypothetical protein
VATSAVVERFDVLEIAVRASWSARPSGGQHLADCGRWTPAVDDPATCMHVSANSGRAELRLRPLFGLVSVIVIVGRSLMAWCLTGRIVIR